MAALGALLASVALVAAARPSLHVSPASAAPGARVRVSGNAGACPRRDTVFVISRAFPGRGFAGIGAITATVGAKGVFAAGGRVRRDARKGRYAVTARCGGGNLGVLVWLRVV